MRRSLVKIVGISLICDKNGDRVSKNGKSSHICSMRLKVVLVKYQKYRTLSMYNCFDPYTKQAV